ncbi:hypothetical protein CI238_12962, partial [Colletotrichum incanum]
LPLLLTINKRRQTPTIPFTYTL